MEQKKIEQNVPTMPTIPKKLKKDGFSSTHSRSYYNDDYYNGYWD